MPVNRCKIVFEIGTVKVCFFAVKRGQSTCVEGSLHESRVWVQIQLGDGQECEKIWWKLLKFPEQFP